MQFDFSEVLERTGTNIVRELQQKMLQQTGTDKRAYSALHPKTIKQKQRISAQTATLRMIRTKDFLNNAFEFEQSLDGLKVFVSPSKHGRELKSMRRTLKKYLSDPGKHGKKVAKQQSKIQKASSAAPSYKEIAGWQLDTGAAIFFPQSNEEINNLEAVERGFSEFVHEAERQMAEQFDFSMRMELSVG